ncbi:hypothetical protein BH09MYX1_BH09MYX1_49120 [soil metagenome]
MTDDPKKTDEAGADEDKSEGWDEAEKIAESVRPPPPPPPADDEPSPGHEEDDIDGEEHRDHLARAITKAKAHDDAHPHPLHHEVDDAHAHADHADDADHPSHASDDDDDDDDAPPRIVKKRPALLLAEFGTTAEIIHAAEKVRDAGYTVWDTHTPFPVHGMDKAMGLKDSFIGLLVFCGGLAGVTTAVIMIWWMNGVDYPIVIGGKPPFSLPSSVPIMFELMILFASLTAVFGMFGINKLPRHHHPIFESERFRSATDDKFFLSVEAEDPKFDPERTKQFLSELNPAAIELLEEEVEEEAAAEEQH